MRTDVGTFNLKVFESNQTRIDFSSSHIKFLQGLNLLHLISNTLSSQFTTMLIEEYWRWRVWGAPRYILLAFQMSNIYLFHRMKNLCKLCKRLLNEQIKDTVGANILYLVKSKVSWLLCGCPEKAVCLFNQRKQLNVRQSLEKRQ